MLFFRYFLEWSVTGSRNIQNRTANGFFNREWTRIIAEGTLNMMKANVAKLQHAALSRFSEVNASRHHRRDAFFY